MACTGDEREWDAALMQIRCVCVCGMVFADLDTLLFRNISGRGGLVCFSGRGHCVQYFCDMDAASGRLSAMGYNLSICQEMHDRFGRA